MRKDSFSRLVEICPLTMAMFSKFVCNKPVTIPNGRLVDKNHMKFLIMMPKDLLEVKLSSRAFFDNLRRLITIEKFLKNNSLDVGAINNELKISVNERLYNQIRNNEEIEKNTVDFLRKIMKNKIEIIENCIKDGKK